MQNPKLVKLGQRRPVAVADSLLQVIDLPLDDRQVGARLRARAGHARMVHRRAQQQFLCSLRASSKSRRTEARPQWPLTPGAGFLAATWNRSIGLVLPERVGVSTRLRREFLFLLLRVIPPPPFPPRPTFLRKVIARSIRRAFPRLAEHGIRCRVSRRSRRDLCFSGHAWSQRCRPGRITATRRVDSGASYPAQRRLSTRWAYCHAGGRGFEPRRSRLSD